MNFRDILTKPISHFGTIADQYDTPTGPLFFQDNGADILGVAHLDTVLKAKPFFSGDIVYTPMLDDRLGVEVLLNLLPARGIKLDVLLTDGEESGRSTGQYFEPAKQYKWIVEFDRCGSDVVMYDYETALYRGMLADYFEVGHGSYSDISTMEWLEVFAFNVGVGYHEEHTRNCWADLNETHAQLDRFCEFYRNFRDVALPHEATGWGWDDSTDYEEDAWSIEAQDIISDYGYDYVEDRATRWGYADIEDFVACGGESLL
jgi:hypothetical protein